MSTWKFLSLVLIIVAAGSAGACAANGTSDGGNSTSSSSDVGGSGAGPSSGGMGGGFNEGGNLPMGQTIVITPSTFELIVDENNVPTQPLVAKINGQDVTGEVTWSFEKPLMGDVEGSEFVPSGGAGGVGTLTAVLGTSFGQATATVYVTKVIGSASIDPSAKAGLDAPSGGADPVLDWLYPFDQTVFPLDVLGPELMWNGAQSADVYKLHIHETYFDYTEYFTSPEARHLLEEAEWTNLSVSGAGAESDPVSVSLGRYSSGTGYEPLERTWRIAQGKLKGVVYYWELPDQCGGENGRVLKIKPSEDQAVEFYQPGGCWGCHTVSRNGQKMFATLDSGFPFPQVTVDLAADPPVAGSITPQASLAGTFGAFNDKGDRIIVSNDDSSNPSKVLTIVDASNGGALAGNVMGTGCGEPAWSPDGTKLAAVCGLGGAQGWIFDMTNGHLSVADVAADGFTVSNQQTIVPQLGEAGRPAYPSFAPGSEYIAFGRPTTGSRSTGDGTLWLTDLTGTNVKPLKNASEGQQSFNPVFAPLRAGGYFWLVYISRRDYGNRLVGANRQQLWITAIQDPPTAEDPSSPPFYLRGQQDCGKSENAYFALEPCKEIGQACDSGVDCCNGNCLKDPDTGEYTCGEPSDCSLDGNACEIAADCCNPNADCLDGFCTPPIPQ